MEQQQPVAEASKKSFLVIDPFVPSISRLDFDPSVETLSVMRGAIQCDLVDCVCLGETLDGQTLDMWVDDEGLFVPGQQTFAILGEDDGDVMQIISGRAVIAASDDEGGTLGLDDPVGEFERLKRRIGFAVAAE